MSSPRTKLAGIAPGVLQAVALQLHHTDYIQFAKSCGRFKHLLLDKRFMHRLMYKSLHFAYYPKQDYGSLAEIQTYLPNERNYGYYSFWNTIGRMYEYSLHGDICSDRNFTKIIRLTYDDKISCVGYRVSQEKYRVYFYYNYVGYVESIALIRKTDWVRLTIYKEYNMYSYFNKHWVIDCELIDNINSDCSDMHYLKNLEQTHFQKHLDTLYNLPKI